MLDTYREVVTPEGVSLHLPAAGPVPRAVAWAIDLGIRIGILLLTGMLFGLLGAAGQGLYLILTFLIFWAYPILFETLWNGQTPGKKAMSLRVVASNGAPVGWLPAITRNLLRTVDMLPFGYATGLIACLADPYARRLGDMVAGTLVVHSERERESSAAPINAVVAPAMPLQPAEQAAVVAFGERAPALTPGRQEELADLVEPMTGSRGQAGVLRLYGIANWLLGRR
jgi:uncharacterized RDD family membrane protein YckC